MDRPDLPRCDRTATVRVSGDLDPRRLVALDVAISSAVTDGVTSLEVDLDEVTFTSNAVLGALVAARRRCRRGGIRMVVHCVDPAMSRLLAITGLDGSLRDSADGVPRQLRRTA